MLRPGIGELIVLDFIAICFLLWLLALIDILRSEFSGSNKIIWFFVIILIPFGFILYFLIGRKQKIGKEVTTKGGGGTTPELVKYSDNSITGCWAIVRMHNGDPCWIGIAQTGILVKKSRTGLLGATLYEETSIFKAGRAATALWLSYPCDLTPDTMQNPVLKAVTNAVLHCNSLAEVVGVLNKATAVQE
jgi:hypothetical protein